MKGPDSGRILRSGRRLLPDQSVEDKTLRGMLGGDKPKLPPPPKNNDVSKAEAEQVKAQVKRGRNGDRVDRMYGKVYIRKRRRTAGALSLDLFKKKREETGETVFSVVVKPCAGKSGQFTSLLVSMLRYMRRVTVTLPELFAFFRSEPIHSVFGSHGLQFLQGASPLDKIGISRFYGITQFIPSFDVDFSVVPVYFAYLHSSMHLDFLFRSFFIVHNPIHTHSDEEEIDFPEYKNKLQISFDTVETEPLESGTVTLDVIESSDTISLPSSSKGTRLAGSRNGQFRSVMNSRGIKKRRSSLRKRKAQSPLKMTLRRRNGDVPSDLVSGRKHIIQFSGMTSRKRHRRLAYENTAGSLKEPSSANILVTESDRSDKEDGTIDTSEMSDRNISGPVAKFIPVPGVQGASSYAENNDFIFQRPDTYISVHDDEITRAMARKTPNYDMDSEDEEWLNKLNNEFQECVSEDKFEIMIDYFEKVYYCNQDDSFDVKSVACHCQDLVSKEVVEAVSSYWMQKRKHTSSSLSRIFQTHSSKGAPFLPKPLLRKKRSSKRHSSHRSSMLRAYAAEQEAFKENAMLKIKEAKVLANKAMEKAIQKRKRAQSLAENADLATYKAAMLLKIAEAAVDTKSVEVGAKYFLDD